MDQRASMPTHVLPPCRPAGFTRGPPPSTTPTSCLDHMRSRPGGSCRRAASPARKLRRSHAMKRPLSVRYCRSCGARLAGSNREDHCAPCQRKARALVTGPPGVPVGFWMTDRMRDALASWHMGKVIAAYRMNPQHARPIPQEIVGGWVGITQAQLSRIENGPPIKDLDRLTQWATLLGIPPDLLWFKLPRADRGPRDVFSNRGSDGPGSRLLPTVSDTWRDNDADASAVRAFRAADKRVGGGYLYPTVVTYLRTEVGPRLVGCASTGNGNLFA